MVSVHPYAGYPHSIGEAQKGTKAQRGEITCPPSHSEEMVRLGLNLGSWTPDLGVQDTGALGDEAVGFWRQDSGTAVGPHPSRLLLSSD